jgi:Mrp family chromosome partitioning ATPase
MGRMLEMLKKADGQRAVAPASPNPKSPAADDCVIDWAVGETTMPYIEVGGPGKTVEGSAEVMAVTHPPQVKQPPHAPTSKALSQSIVLAQLTDAKPLTVAFEPWNGPAAGSTGIAPEIIAYHQPAHTISKQYVELWNTMIAGFAELACPTLLLTGLRSQVGTTTVLVNLAVTGATQGRRRVAVVDAQTKQPSIAARLGIKPDLGLLDVVAGQAALEQTLIKSPIPTLHALPVASRRDDVTLTRDAVAWLIGRLRERFDAIVIDGPNLTETDALAAVAPACDALYLVAPQGESKSLPREALLTIARLGGKLRGLLHTHFEI